MSCNAMSSADKRLEVVRTLIYKLDERSDELAKRREELAEEAKGIESILRSLREEQLAILEEKKDLAGPLVVFREVENTVGYRVYGEYRLGDRYVQIKRPGPGFQPFQYPVSELDVGMTFK